MSDFIRQLLDPTLPWQRIKYPRDFGSALAINFAHALVRFEGKRRNGKMEARSAFYVAQFEDGLISRLYLG